jgi:pimeloyl-ACP methyl ester carboxylesterase
MRMLLTTIAIAIGLYVAVVALAYLFQERLLYFPLRGLSATPDAIGLAYETVSIETEDGIEISGWFIPADRPRGTLLFFHGNAGNISHRLDSIAAFHRLGLNTFIVDYRGYGQSQGKPTEQGTYRDAAAAWRYLVESRQIPPTEIIIFGRSLGGAVAAWLAHTHPPGALILESTFTSAPDMAAQAYPFLPVRQLIRIDYNTLARLPKIEVPLLIIHSPEDSVIPYGHSQTLFNAANQPKEFLEIRGGHNDGFIISAQAYEATLDRFISTYIDGP